MKDFNDICLALAAICQASYLLDKLAQTGQCDDSEYHALRETIFAIDSDSVNSLYGGRQGLQTGLRTLSDILQSAKHRQHALQLSRYMISAMQLARSLQKSRDLQSKVTAGLKRIKQQREFQTTMSDADLDRLLAQLYRDSFGSLNYRANITGKRQHLENDAITNRCRCLLFSAVRAAILWRQVGGNHWQLLFRRKHLQQLAKQFLLSR